MTTRDPDDVLAEIMLMRDNPGAGPWRRLPLHVKRAWRVHALELRTAAARLDYYLTITSIEDAKHD